MRSTPQSPKAIGGAISAYLAKCAQIADPEVARFGQFSPTRRLKAQQGQIHMKNANASGPDQTPPRADRSFGGMVTPPDGPSRGLVLRSEDPKEGDMIDIRHPGARPFAAWPRARL
jgi:hypothetical protein